MPQYPNVFLDRWGCTPYTYDALKSILPSELNNKTDLVAFGNQVIDRSIHGGKGRKHYKLQPAWQCLLWRSNSA